MVQVERPLAMITAAGKKPSVSGDQIPAGCSSKARADYPTGAPTFIAIGIIRNSMIKIDLNRQRCIAGIVLCVGIFAGKHLDGARPGIHYRGSA